MNAIVTFAEVSSLIEKKFNVRPIFNRLDDRTIEVSYKPGAIVPTINVKLHVEDVQDDTVHLSYDCGTAVSLMIVGVVAYLQEKIPHGIQVNTDEKRINLFPLQIKELEKVVEYVSVSDITFDEKSVCVSLMMI